jgi:hypothetical protein
MTDSNEDTTRARAYRIWENAGKPEGSHESHWYQALKELGLISPIEQPEGSTVSSEAIDASLSDGDEGRRTRPGDQ